MTSRTKSAFGAFAIFGLVMGAYFALATRNLLLGLVIGLIAGAGFAVVMWLFSVVVQRFRMFGIKNVTGWANDEVVIRSCPANMFRHGIAEGGILFLTNTRVRFRTHRASAEVGDYSFPVAHISSIQPYRTLGVLPNGIEVNMSNGRSNRFVVSDRAEWLRHRPAESFGQIACCERLVRHNGPQNTKAVYRPGESLARSSAPHAR